MANFSEIISKNSQTFYDYGTGVQRSVYPRLVITMAISVFLATLITKTDGGFISAVLTVQSILVGFSFSVLFFLLSGAEIKNTKYGSIEHIQKVKKLKLLSEELFYNISYYNMIAIFSVILSLLLLLPDVDTNTGIAKTLVTSVDDIGASVGLSDTTKHIVDYVGLAMRIAFYFLIIESMYTFWRTVRRVSFFFAEKISLGANVGIAPAAED